MPYQPFNLSGFNIYHPAQDDKMVVFNTLTAQFVELDNKEIRRLRSGKQESIDGARLNFLSEKGILSRSHQEELSTFLERARLRKSEECWADITFLSAPSDDHSELEQDSISRMMDSIEGLKSANDIKSLKIRFCGFSSRSLEKRLSLFQQINQSLQHSKVSVVNMWMSDQLIEVLKTQPQGADSFFFGFNPNQQILPRLLLLKVFLRIQKMVDSKKVVMIQTLINGEQDIKVHSSALREMAKNALHIDQQYLKWGMRLSEDSGELYYSPEDCSRPDIELEKIRSRCKWALKDLGLPVPNQVKLFQFHHDCLAAQKYSKIFDWRGFSYSCLKNAPKKNMTCQLPHHKTDFEKIEQRTRNKKCGSCPVLPLCAASCSLHLNPHECGELPLLLHERVSGILSDV